MTQVGTGRSSGRLSRRDEAPTLGGVTMDRALVIRTSTFALLFALGLPGYSDRESTSSADAQPARSWAIAKLG